MPNNCKINKLVNYYQYKEHLQQEILEEPMSRVKFRGLWLDYLRLYHAPDGISDTSF